MIIHFMKNITVAVTTALLLGMSSCTDLSEEYYDTVNSEIFPKTEADAEALVNQACYYQFQVNAYSTISASNIDNVGVFTELTTDIGNSAWKNGATNDLMQVNFSTNTGIINTYINLVKQISSCLNTKNAIQDVPMSQQALDSFNGQLSCAMGWMGYVLLDLFGPFQVPDQEHLDHPYDVIPLPRLSYEQSVKFIEDNLLEATRLLPARHRYGSENYGRFHRGVAYTILMKLYMHEKNWEKAIACGRELMKPEYGYDLVKHYPDIFTLENEGNDETIYAGCCTNENNGQLWYAHVLPSDYPTKNPNIQKWNGWHVLWSFYETFDPSDERLKVLVGEYIGTDGQRYNKSNPGVGLADGALPIKYGEDPNDTGQSSAIDFILLRYADVLTMMSEALARHSNSVTPEALELLNRVHTRAGLKKYGSVNSLDDCLDANLTERGHELWFEGGCRRSDLIRYGRYIQYARKYRNSSSAQDYMEVFPLPQYIIDESRGQVIQNPEY